MRLRFMIEFQIINLNKKVKDQLLILVGYHNLNFIWESLPVLRILFDLYVCQIV